VVVREVSRLDAAVARSRIRSRYKKYVYYIQQGWRPDLELGKFSWFIGKKVDPQRLRDALQCVISRVSLSSPSSALTMCRMQVPGGLARLQAVLAGTRQGSLRRQVHRSDAVVGRGRRSKVRRAVHSPPRSSFQC
jgi:hypothetical protein